MTAHDLVTDFLSRLSPAEREAVFERPQDLKATDPSPVESINIGASNLNVRSDPS